jgi:hypothetical protein
MPPASFSKAHAFLLLIFLTFGSLMAKPSHPRLLADAADIAQAKRWYKQHSWYRRIFDQNQTEIDRFLKRRPVYVSPVKQTYQYKMYTCPKHDVELKYELFRPHEHRCPVDTSEVHRGEKYDSAWSGWYNRQLATYLVWMGTLYQVQGEKKYAEAGREILMQFAELYLKFPTTNTILARRMFSSARSRNHFGAWIWRLAMTCFTTMKASPPRIIASSKKSSSIRSRKSRSNSRNRPPIASSGTTTFLPPWVFFTTMPS